MYNIIIYMYTVYTSIAGKYKYASHNEFLLIYYRYFNLYIVVFMSSLSYSIVE